MRKTEFIKILIEYGKHHWMSILAFTFEMGIYLYVFYLYGLRMEAVWYATVLIIIPLILLVLLRFLRFYRKHKLLDKLYHMPSIIEEGMPKTYDIMEEDYQRIIRLLCQENRSCITKTEKNYRDMIDFYTLWAHQIKTPIAAMRLLLQAEEKQNASELKQELFKIERYVEVVLGYLRTEEMNHDLQIETCCLDELVKQAVKKYTTVFVYQRLKLEMENLNFPVLTDQKWLVFVLEQLISNALKYTKVGSIKISAAVTETKEGDIHTTLYIEDTGIGIRAEDLPRIFEKGFTGYNGRMDKKASGLGLYLCKKITEQLSHKIIIESEVNCGTKVSILFRQSSS